MTELKKVFQNKLHNRADFLNLIPFLKLQNVPKSRIHLNTYQRGAYIQGVGVISLGGGGLVIGSLRCFRLTILENQKLRGSEQVVASLQSNVKDRFCFFPPYHQLRQIQTNIFSRSFSSTYNDLRTLFGNNFCFVPFVLL